MTEPWIIFYGHQINMTSEETLNTRWGLFMDLMSCAAIDSGGADEKKKKLSQEDILFDLR